LNEGSYNLRLNDEISFIEVRRTGGGGGGWGDDKDGVVLYTERSQRGDEQAFDVGTYRNDYRQLGRIGNDNASSVFVSPGYRVRICETEGGGSGAGRCEEYSAGSYNLRYNDTASFVRVWRGR